MHIRKRHQIKLEDISRQRVANLLVTVAMVISLMAAFEIVYWLIKKDSMDFCLHILEQETLEVTHSIDRGLSSFEENLDALADILSEMDSLESDEVKDLLKLYNNREASLQIGLLFPDNRALLQDGTFTTPENGITFDAAAEKGFRKPDNSAVFYLVPLKSGGETKAILFEQLNLKNLMDRFEEDSFYGTANLTVVDVERMDIVMDTIHGQGGDAGQFPKRKIKSGFSEQQLIQDLSEGRGGVTAYYSNTLQEYLYTAYEPIAIHGWLVLLSVPESMVLSLAEYSKNILFGMGIFESIVLGLYFLRVLIWGRKEVKAKESEIKQVYYMYDIQKILFDAYRQPENMKSSLEQIGMVTGAQSVFLAAVDQDKVRKTFIWNETEGAALQGKARQRQFVEAIVSHMPLKPSGYVAGVDDKEPEADQKILEILKDFHQNNVMAVPIEGEEHQVIAVLAAVNLRDRWDSATPLSCLTLSFSMALYNMQAYQTIEKMGVTDALTDLFNRNAYEQALAKYETDRPECLTCIYADANGLHELNNSQGHAAGDRMLQTVAAALKDAFEEGRTYRIGGDEFLVFTKLDEDTAAQYAAAAKKEAAGQGYHVSIGTASGGKEVSAASIVKTAEQRMYEDKKQYYAGRNDRRKMRG